MELLKLIVLCSVITNIHFLIKLEKERVIKKRIKALMQKFRRLEVLDEHNLMAELILLDENSKLLLLDLILKHSTPSGNNLRIAINILELINNEHEEPLKI